MSRSSELVSFFAGCTFAWFLNSCISNLSLAQAWLYCGQVTTPRIVVIRFSVKEKDFNTWFENYFSALHHFMIVCSNQYPRFYAYELKHIYFEIILFFWPGMWFSKFLTCAAFCVFYFRRQKSWFPYHLLPPLWSIPEYCCKSSDGTVVITSPQCSELIGNAARTFMDFRIIPSHEGHWHSEKSTFKNLFVGLPWWRSG